MQPSDSNTQPTYTNTTPTPQSQQVQVQAQPQRAVLVKPKSTWKLKLIIFLLLLLLLGTLGAGGYFGYKGYEELKEKREKISDLEDENSKLKKIQNTSASELQKQIENLESQKKTLEDENKKLKDDLAAANKKVEDLREKDITEFDYKNNIKINSEEDGVWLEPIYSDLNNDGKKDGVFAYQMSGTGKFLNVYAYSYTNNEPTEILRAEEYQKGTFEVLTDGVVQIRFTSGTPDSPITAVSKFKWDAKEKKLIKQ